MKEMRVGRNICDIHGAEFIDWKCMYCCSIALYNCGGSIFYCGPCHDDITKRPKKDCGGVNCPLKIPHPPAGNDPKKSAFALGCSICRSNHLENYDRAQEIVRAMIDEEGVEAFVNADRFMHKSVKLRGGKKGKKKAKKGPAIVIRAAVRPAKKKKK